MNRVEGNIWTPLVEKLGKESPEGVEKFREKLDSLHPIGSVGEPIDVAYGILYLASDESKFLTGSELVIDGGYTARKSLSTPQPFLSQHLAAYLSLQLHTYG